VGVTCVEKVTATYPISFGEPAKSEHKRERNQVRLQEQDTYRLPTIVTKTMDLLQDSLFGIGDWFLRLWMVTHAMTEPCNLWSCDLDALA
jgi:hypothetical protein